MHSFWIDSWFSSKNNILVLGLFIFRALEYYGRAPRLHQLIVKRPHRTVKSHPHPVRKQLINYMSAL